MDAIIETELKEIEEALPNTYESWSVNTTSIKWTLESLSIV